MLAAFNGTARKNDGSVAANATVEVRRESDGALAAIYSDEAGTTPITNPSAFADSNGRFRFYALGNDRGFQITVTKDAESYSMRNVGIGTGSQVDQDAFGRTLMNTAAAADARGLLKAAVVVRSSNTVHAVADVGTAFVATAAFTQTFAPAATLGAGWHVWWRNNSGGTLTFDPDSSELIDDATTAALLNGESALIVCTGSGFRTYGRSLRYPPMYLNGFTVSNNGGDPANDLDVAAGKCRSDDDAEDIVLASSMTKRVDASWAAGTGNGGFDTGSVGATDTVHVYAIKNPASGAVDVLLSVSLTPTMPTGYTRKRRIASIPRVSSAFLGFSQYGHQFLLTTVVKDIDDATNSSSAQTGTLASVPTDIKVFALLGVTLAFISPNNEVYVSSLDQTDQAPSLTLAPLFTTQAFNTGDATFATWAIVRTNTSAQIRFRKRQAATDSVRIATLGWIDERGVV